MSTKMSPFKATYGYLPPQLPTYELGTTVVATVDEELWNWDQLLGLFRENLHKAQNRMRKYTDMKRTEREFQVGDLVYLRLQPYWQILLRQRHNMKLSSRYYGPFPVTERIWVVAYRLDLPPDV